MLSFVISASDISPLIREHMEAGTNYIQVHPTFLYEGLWNLMVFAVMLLYRRRKKFHGELFLVYLAGYGIGRAVIESIRTDQLYVPGTKAPVSMILGILIAAVSIVLIFAGRRKADKVPAPETAGSTPDPGADDLEDSANDLEDPGADDFEDSADDLEDTADDLEDSADDLEDLADDLEDPACRRS